MPLVSGSRPRVIVSDHAEIVEAPASDKPQEIPAAPVAINGRLDGPAQQDRYRLAVTPGAQLRFDVLARRAGSPLDGVLSIQNEQGAELAGNDDRPGTSDPGLDFKVPDGVNAVVVALRDLSGRGGADYIYRISVATVGAPDFSLSLVAPFTTCPRTVRRWCACAHTRRLQRTDQAEFSESSHERLDHRRRDSRGRRRSPGHARARRG